MNQNRTGWLIIATAFALTVLNVSDAIKDLQEWHSATTPAFVGVLLKQVASTALAALGGKMTNPFGGNP